MKKNYFYPETETVQLKGCGIICTSPGNPPSNPDTPGGPGLGAPARKIYM